MGCGKVDFENINYLELSPRCYVPSRYNKININELHISRFSRNTASLKLQKKLGDDYSEDADYEYRDVDPSRVGDFNSEHRLVGGKVEK